MTGGNSHALGPPRAARPRLPPRSRRERRPCSGGPSPPIPRWCDASAASRRTRRTCRRWRGKMCVASPGDRARDHALHQDERGIAGHVDCGERLPEAVHDASHEHRVPAFCSAAGSARYVARVTASRVGVPFTDTPVFIVDEVFDASVDRHLATQTLRLTFRRCGVGGPGIAFDLVDPPSVLLDGVHISSWHDSSSVVSRHRMPRPWPLKPVTAPHLSAGQRLRGGQLLEHGVRPPHLAQRLGGGSAARPREDADL